MIEIRKKIKDEYKGLNGKEIVELKKKGIDICNDIEFPLFCFLGDTSKKILDDNSIEKYQTIMIECTFINDDDLVQADKTNHMHWQYLKDYIIDHPNNKFILYHFSRRYKREEIAKFFENQHLDNIIPWIS